MFIIIFFIKLKHQDSRRVILNLTKRRQKGFSKGADGHSHSHYTLAIRRARNQPWSSGNYKCRDWKATPGAQHVVWLRGKEPERAGKMWACAVVGPTADLEEIKVQNSGGSNAGALVDFYLIFFLINFLYISKHGKPAKNMYLNTANHIFVFIKIILKK